MSGKSIAVSIIIIFITMGLLTSCGETFSDTIHMGSTMKDGGKISVDVTIFVENQDQLDLLEKKNKRIKQAFQIIFTEYRSPQLESHGKRTTLGVVQKILDNRLNFDIVKFELSNLKIKPRT